VALIDKRRLLEAALRSDLAAFVRKSFSVVSPGVRFSDNWHIHALAHELDRVRRGETKRLLVTMQPRSLKSICASVAFPAYVLGHDPTKRIVCVSYAEDLAAKHARDCRAVMASGWHRRLFPITRLSRTKNAELDFETTRGGGRLSTSVGGSLTGRGGSLIIIDDPQKPGDAMSEARRASVLDWFRNTLSSRLDNKAEDAIVVVMQRLHVDDLAGHLLETGNWTHLNLPAIALSDGTIELGNGCSHRRRTGDLLHPEREPLEVLNEIRATMGEFHFSAQYQQSPLPEEGNLLKWEWFERFAQPPQPESGGRIVQSWDFAVKDGEQNDWSVCVTAYVKGNAVFVLDIYRERLNYPGQREAVIRFARQHRARVILIEGAANGSPLVSDLRHLNQSDVPTPLAITPKGSKTERLAVQSHRIEAGDVRLPEKAPWLDAFRAEILAFPLGRHDDQVDALSQLLAWTERQRLPGHVSLFAPKIFVAD
jgi:predicted phage terminase large subunit-like protein